MSQASIPFMITNRMRSTLRDAGFSDDEIAHMKPEEAWELLGGTPSGPVAQYGGGGEARFELLGWEVRTLADAYKPRPPIQYVVEGLFALPSLSIVYSPPGCFKTMLLADMAACVASGMTWLPTLPHKTDNVERATRQSSVLWLDFDNGTRTMDERIEAVGRARGLDTSTPLYYVPMPTPWLNAGKWSSMDELVQRIKLAGAELVIVDNLRNVCGGADENSAQIGDVMANFRRVSEMTGAAIILVHHQRKASGIVGRAGDTLRGHSSIEAAIDLAILIEREEGADSIKIRATKTRGADVYPFGAMFTYTHKSGTRELQEAKFYGLEVEDLSSDRAIRRTILEVVKLNPGINKGSLVKEVKENLADVGTPRVSTQIENLVSEGKLTKQIGQRNANMYNIPTPDPWNTISQG